MQRVKEAVCKQPSIDLFAHCLMVTIKRIWLRVNTPHLISVHQTSPVIPDSWEAEKAKVQFNRFTARQNWVVVVVWLKPFSPSVYILVFHDNESWWKCHQTSPSHACLYRYLTEHSEESSLWFTAGANGWSAYNLDLPGMKPNFQMKLIYSNWLCSWVKHILFISSLEMLEELSTSEFHYGDVFFQSFDHKWVCISPLLCVSFPCVRMSVQGE